MITIEEEGSGCILTSEECMEILFKDKRNINNYQYVNM